MPPACACQPRALLAAFTQGLLVPWQVVAKFSTEVHTVWSLSPLNLLGVSALLDRSLYMNPLDNQTKT